MVQTKRRRRRRLSVGLGLQGLRRTRRLETQAMASHQAQTPATGPQPGGKRRWQVRQRRGAAARDAPRPMEFWRLTGCSSTPPSDLGESERERRPVRGALSVADCTGPSQEGSCLRGVLAAATRVRPSVLIGLWRGRGSASRGGGWGLRRSGRGSQPLRRASRASYRHGSLPRTLRCPAQRPSEPSPAQQSAKAPAAAPALLLGHHIDTSKVLRPLAGELGGWCSRLG